MNSATISADVIAYTSLPGEARELLDKKIKKVLTTLTEKYADYEFFGRTSQGDHIECALRAPEHALRIALILKTGVKSLNISFVKNKTKVKHFVEHGIRLAIGIAALSRIDAANGIIDGEAIYMSGRALKMQSTSDKEKVIIKRTMFFRSNEPEVQDKMDAIVALLDKIIARSSAKQCEVVYHKLLGMSEKEISTTLNRYQSTISQHSTAAGWHAIEKAVDYFEKNIRQCSYH
jgi:DNA-binding NarL/FixJ family response regulator